MKPTQNSSAVENSIVPVIETGVGNCHVYVDAAADLEMAERITLNAKVQRPSVCNSAETLLVHRAVAAEFLPRVAAALHAEGVTLHADEATLDVVGAGELTVFCGAMVGASLGFLWFNAPPAMVFMGDTGSLSIGAALGTISVVTKHELVLAIVGGLFVLEAASVIVQVASFKITGRRVFRMAPLHHHFEQKGWAEPTIVIRFWIIAWILAIAGLATLKLR